MIFDPDLSAELDRRLTEATERFIEKRRRAAMQRFALKQAREAGKAARHSAREHPREPKRVNRSLENHPSSNQEAS